MKVLLAVREQEKNNIISVLQKTNILVDILNTVTDFANTSDSFELAIVDEDFDSLHTGWQLASLIRDKKPSTKIVMIVRKNPKVEYLPLYDATFGLPVSEDELIGEIYRK